MSENQKRMSEKSLLFGKRYGRSFIPHHHSLEKLNHLNQLILLGANVTIDVDGVACWVGDVRYTEEKLEITYTSGRDRSVHIGTFPTDTKFSLSLALP